MRGNNQKNVQKFVSVLGVVLAVLLLASSSMAAINNQIFALSQKIDVDPTTGTSVTSIPISVPSGRAGIQPNLNLFYNSSGGQGAYGVGWMLDLGSIQRSLKRGVPLYTATDTYIFQSGSSQELVDISGNGSKFRPQVEESFSKVEFLSTYWLVTDKKGTKYRFGFADSSRVFDPGNSSRIFKWALDRVEDINGNYMTISYIKDGNSLFPDEINYTGHDATNAPTFAKVKFSWSARTDSTVQYLMGFRIDDAKRLVSIETRVNGNLFNKYQFEYIADSQTARSLLTKVTQLMSDGASSLPAINFTYSSARTGFDSAANMGNYPNRNISEGTTRLMDMNSDGFVDLIEIVGASSTDNFKIYFNDKLGNFQGRVSAVNTPDLGMNPDLRFHDFNGDGLVDVVQGSSCPYRIWINNGVNGYHSPFTVSNCPGFSINHQNWLQFVDMNRDGKVDMLDTSRQSGSYQVYLNTGGGNFAPPIEAINSPSQGADNPNLNFGDFNGDGLVDVIIGGSAYVIWINNGQNGFNAPRVLSNYPEIVLSSQNLVQLMDFNGDGLTDILRSFGDGAAYQLYLNNGGDFNPPINLANSPSRSMSNLNVKLVDINGDGLTDVFMGLPSSEWNVYLSNGKDGFLPGISVSQHHASAGLDDNNLMLTDLNGDNLPDMIYGTAGSPYKTWFAQADTRSAKSNVLVAVDNSLGARTEIQYMYLPVNAILGWQYKIAYNPVLFNTVKKNTLRLAQGDDYVTSYLYKSCQWNYPQREFRGFGLVRVTDAEGNYSETKYAQDDIFKGRINEQASFNAQGSLLGKMINTWNYQTLSPNVNFVFLRRADRFVYDGNASGKRTTQEFYYEEPEQLGNLTKTIELGEVDLTTGDDVGQDTRKVESDYWNNISGGNWLIGLPKQIRSFDYAGNLARKSWFYYDGSTSDTTLPVKGLLTLKKAWGGPAADASHPQTKYAYDEYGNLKSTEDPLNNITTVIFDSQYHFYPILSVNALGHEIENEFYGVDGVPLSGSDGFQGLWGQLKSTTDPNDQKLKRIYDVFGRTIKEITPLDSPAFPTTSFEYEITPQYTAVTTYARVQSGQAATIDSKTFYDGVGRALQTKTMAQQSGRYVVSGQGEYNSRGLKTKQYLPFFSTNAFANLEPMNTGQPFSFTQYDANGRSIQVTNADGSRENVVYDDWATITTDANGHMVKSYVDAYGRLVKKEEYFGADGRSPQYPVSPYTLYATTRYVYDSEGNLTQTIDNQNNVTTIAYDNLGRKVSMDDPDMGFWQYGYDRNGNLKWQIDAKNQRLDFNYDALNRLTNKTDHASINVDYTFDDATVEFAKGRLTQAQYGVGNSQFKYDLLGREIKSIKDIDVSPFQVERTYDVLNRLKDIKYPNAQQVSYQYNPAGQIAKVDANYRRVLPPAATVLNPATGQNQSVLLSWAAVEGASYYIVKYGTAAGSYTQEINAGGASSLLVSNLTNGVTYYFAVAAGNYTGRGPISNEVSATPVAPQLAGINFDNSSTVEADSVSTLNLNHVITVGGTNRVLIVNVAMKRSGGTPSVSSLKYAGVNMTKIRSHVNASSSIWYGVEQWYLLNPPTGVNTVAATFNSSINAVTLNAISLTGVKQAAPLTSAQKSATSSSVSQSLNVNTKDSWIIDSLLLNSTTDSAMAGAGQTERFVQINSGDFTHKGSHKAVSVAGANATGWNFSSSKFYVYLSAAFAPAPTVAMNSVIPANAVIQSWRPSLVGMTEAIRNFFSIPEAWAAMGLDLTTFTAIPSAKLSVSSDCVNFTNIETRSTNAYVMKPYDVTGDFSFQLDTIVTSSDAFSGDTAIWGATNQANTTINNWSSGIYLGHYVSGTIYNLKLTNAGSTADTSTNLTLNRRYYLNISRTGSTVSVAIYSDPARTVFVDTLTRTNATNFSYLYVFSTKTGTALTKKASGDVCHVSDQNAVVSLPPSAPVLNDPVLQGQNVVLAWGAVSDVTGYKVKYGTQPGVYSTTLDVGNVLNYSVNNLTDGATYYFAISAYNAAGEGPISDGKSIVIPSANIHQAIITSVDYNENNQITKIVYGNGTVTTQEYYPLNFRLKRIYTVSAQGEALQDFVYAYDTAGQVTNITDNVHTATQTFAYDAINRLVGANGLTYGHKTFVYDSIGNILQKDDITYTYGEAGAGPHAVTSLSDGTVIQYDANGNMSMKSKNGQVMEYFYDAENHLVEVKRNTDRIATYEYDGDGGRTKRTVYAAADTLNCLLAGTPILMADGRTKPIERIQVGDEVLGFDEKTLQKKAVKVMQTFSHERADSYLIVNDSLKVTADHQFFTQGQWKAIGTLSAGSMLLNKDLVDSPIKILEKVELKKQIQVYNIEVEEVHNYFAGGFLVHNKIMAGALFDRSLQSATTQSTTTTYIGSLYEETNGIGTEFVFLGNARVASITGNDVRFYHDDHLGGTNIITNSSGALQELIEYKPFGEFARQEKPDAAAPVQPYYYTGKPLDDETGLYYFGARYYDATLGRFITPDSIVQAPNNPQTLNRYTYANNNPVNNIDPTGHSFKSFWKKWAGLFGMAGALFKGVLTSDWSTLQAMGTAIVSSAMFSGGNPFAIAAAVVSAGFLDTPSGRQFTKFLSNEVFDDGLGLPPTAAYFAGSMANSALVSSAVYVGITPETYKGPDFRDPKNQNEAIKNYPGKEEAAMKAGNGGASTKEIIESGGKSEWIKPGRIASQNGWADQPGLGKLTKALDINHTAVVVQTPTGLFDSALDNNLLNPFKHGDLWGSPWTGTCQQVSFSTLIEKGGMSGLQAFKAVAQSSGWSYIATSVIYGVRADFGGVGLVNASIQNDH